MSTWLLIADVIRYLIIPDNDCGRDPRNVLAAMVRYMQHDGHDLPKPEITFDVAAGGRSYLQWGKAIFDNQQLRQKWAKRFGWSTTEDTLELAIRTFGDTILNVCAHVVRGVVNSEGWLLFPAGRRPQHQLIGDTIDRFGEELYNQSQQERVVWVQYGS